jgi:hypothetical protein
MAGLFLTSNVNAQTSLFRAENFKGWIDIRASATDAEDSWLNGGYGKLRYGGDNRAKIGIAEAAIIWTPRLSNSWSAYAQLEHTPDAQQATGINEAYFKWRPVPTSSLRLSARVGQFFPPISLEHDGVGWTTPLSITPSAINSWIGEEVIVRGAEFSLKNTFAEHELGLTLGAFSSNDTAGTLLAFRGWAQGDIRAQSGQKLPLTRGAAGWRVIFDRQADYSIPLDEVDGRTGYYFRLDWRPPAPVAFNVEYYNNNGDPEIVKRGQYGWATRFYNVGMHYDVDEKTQILSQYLSGKTAMGFETSSGYRSVDIEYESAYVLISRRLDNDVRLTARADYFTTDDQSLVIIDNNNEVGHSVTFAAMKPLNAHANLSAELLSIKSVRPSRALQSNDPSQSQTLAQVALKLHF